MLHFNDNGARPSMGSAPLGYRFLLAVCDTITSATAITAARTICPTHFFGMNTALLRSVGPDEGVAEEPRQPKSASLRREPDAGLRGDGPERGLLDTR